MAKDVFLSPMAEMNYEDILDYVFENFGARVTDNFTHRFKRVITFIGENPEIYRYVNRSKKIRRCKLTKHNTIYFKEYKKHIRILAIFDNRQNPEKVNTFI